jgi:hypothetical protein
LAGWEIKIGPTGEPVRAEQEQDTLSTSQVQEIFEADHL